jgi:hypothetical protein
MRRGVAARDRILFVSRSLFALCALACLLIAQDKARGIYVGDCTEIVRFAALRCAALQIERRADAARPAARPQATAAARA